MLGPVAAVEYQRDASVGVNPNNKVAFHRASFEAAKNYVDLMVTSRRHFEVAHLTWSNLFKEVCPEQPLESWLPQGDV